MGFLRISTKCWLFLTVLNVFSSGNAFAQSFYEILGVSRNATSSEIKKAHWRLAREYHPDMYPRATEAERKVLESKFGEIQQAYDVLIDDEKRATYDRYGEVSERVIPVKPKRSFLDEFLRFRTSYDGLLRNGMLRSALEDIFKKANPEELQAVLRVLVAAPLEEAKGFVRFYKSEFLELIVRAEFNKVVALASHATDFSALRIVFNEVKNLKPDTVAVFQGALSMQLPSGRLYSAAEFEKAVIELEARRLKWIEDGRQRIRDACLSNLF